MPIQKKIFLDLFRSRTRSAEQLDELLRPYMISGRKIFSEHPLRCFFRWCYSGSAILLGSQIKNLQLQLLGRTRVSFYLWQRAWGCTVPDQSLSRLVRYRIFMGSKFSPFYLGMSTQSLFLSQGFQRTQQTLLLSHRVTIRVI